MSGIQGVPDKMAQMNPGMNPNIDPNTGQQLDFNAMMMMGMVNRKMIKSSKLAASFQIFGQKKRNFGQKSKIRT